MHFVSYFGYNNEKYPKLATYHLGVGNAISQLNAQLALCFPMYKKCISAPSRSSQINQLASIVLRSTFFASVKAFVTFPFFLDSDRAFL